jgi:acetyl-CoA synthetase
MTDSDHGEIFSEEHLKPFLPSDIFKEKALVNDDQIYEQAKKDRLAFWAKMAEDLQWGKKWEQVLDESNPPYFKWFVNGKLNISTNCLDRHLENGKGKRTALIFHGENNDCIKLSFEELLSEVCKFSNVLQELGVNKGDAVTIWMPMVPEAIIAMLACTRIGAIHSVVFGGFSPDALKDRILDSKSKILITADGA